MRHPLPADRLDAATAGTGGLTAAEAAARLRHYGPNDVLVQREPGWRAVARDTARDPMLWFLVATAVLFAALGDAAEAPVLAAALVPMVGMDAWLHRRTQASTAALAGRLSATARVLRDGAPAEVPASALVPGDLVVVGESQAFPADGMIVAGSGLQVDESVLSGEALPLRKHAWPPGDALPQAIEHAHWAAAGTRLLTGEARLRVLFTGGETLYGQIVRSAGATGQQRTPLQGALASLVTVLLIAAVVLCLALALARYVQGHGLLDAALSAITLAVAALPEEFPVVLVFFLGAGVYRLARRGALVRRAVVVENIGRITCICSDKTGTLTEGRLRLVHRLPAAGFDEAQLLAAAALASRPGSGDPMDLAIVEPGPAPLLQRVATFPFTEDRRREVGIDSDAAGALGASAKGAPETILAMSTLDAGEQAAWLRRTRELGASGHKVVACARRALPAWAGGEPDRGYDFLGLLAFEDPVREGVAEAVRAAQAGGIRVLMVTGDHPETARAIALELGIGAGTPRVVEGSELPDHLRRTADLPFPAFDVLARSVPAQKLDLVRRLQAEGHIVAVTGDGVNDVPALQGADVGIAMGERGTQAAREVAAIVLMDDNFRTVVGAIAEGRQLFDNLRLSYAYLLMLHVPLVLSAALIPFAGFPLLYLPAHIVWLELVMHPTALLVFQQLPAAPALRPVRGRERLRFFAPREWAAIAGVAVLLTLVVVFGYARSLGAGRDVEHARTMAIVALLVASAALTAGLAGLRCRVAWPAMGATLLSALVLVQVPALAALLHLSPLHLDDWLLAGAAGALAGGSSALLPLLRRRPAAAPAAPLLAQDQVGRGAAG